MKLEYSGFYRVLHYVLRLLLFIFIRVRCWYEGPGVPGPKLYVVNHPTVYDLFPVMVYGRSRYIHTLVEEQIWSLPVVGSILRMSNQVCLKTGASFMDSFKDSLFLLSKGRSLLMSPEGGRTHPDDDVRARKSVIIMALKGEVPIIPVGVWLNKKDIIIKGVKYNFKNRRYIDMAHFPKFRAKYGILFGRPVYLNEYFGRELKTEEYQGLADRILKEVYRLTEKAEGLLRAWKG